MTSSRIADLGSRQAIVRGCMFCGHPRAHKSPIITYDVAFIPPLLQDIADQLAAGTPEVSATVRTLLRWFGAQRRGYYVVRSIRLALAELGITTEPNFENAWIDEKVLFRNIVVNPPASSVFVPLTPPVPSNTDLSPYVGVAPTLLEDPTHRIGKLDAANRVPKSVTPNSDVSTAITIMLAHDYSQLPIISGSATVKGMVSWRSIGRAKHFGKQIHSVMDCREDHFEIDENASLFVAIPIIVDHEYVLVRSRTGGIKGIVTTADLSLQFRTLAEPFLLLGEAENHIRGMLDRCYSLDELRSGRDPGDPDRDINSAANLNFGEYARILENPERWAKLNLPLDRAVFVAILEDVRRARNAVMHFDADDFDDNDLRVLRDFAKLVRDLAQDKLI